MASAVTASFSAEDFALLRRQFCQRRDVLIIHIVDLVPAEATLCLFMQAGLLLSPCRFCLASWESCHFARILLLAFSFQLSAFSF